MRILGIITLVLTSLFTLLFIGLVVLAVIFFDSFRHSSDIVLVYAVVALAIVHVLELWFNASTIRYHKQAQAGSDAFVLDQLEEETSAPKRSLTPRKRNLGIVVAILTSLVFAAGSLGVVIFVLEELENQREWGSRFEIEALGIFIALLLYVALKLIYIFATLSLRSKPRVQPVS